MTTSERTFNCLVNNLISNPCNGFDDRQRYDADNMVRTCLRYNRMTKEIHHFTVDADGYMRHDEPVSFLRAGQLIKDCIKEVKNGLTTADA